MVTTTKKFEQFKLEVTVTDEFDAAYAEKLLATNNRNRPKKSGAIKRYLEDIIRRKWDLTGEPIILDTNGQLINGQNRCFSLIKAEQMRLKNPKEYEKTYGHRGPIRIPMVIISGVKAAAFRSMDSGEKRSGPDMMFCARLFDTMKDAQGKPKYSDADKKKLSRILATAIRTVWLRTGGMKISDAPSFPPSEMQEFFAEHHPELLSAVTYTYDADAGREQRISSLVSPANMAAVLYLAAVSTSDAREVQDGGELDFSLLPEAQQFVEEFASGTGLEEGNPALALRRAYMAQIKDKSTSRNRDVVLNMMVKAMVLYLDEKKNVKLQDVRWNPAKEAIPRLGGLDVEVEVVSEPSEDSAETKKSAESKPKSKKMNKAKKPVKEAATE